MAAAATQNGSRRRLLARLTISPYRLIHRQRSPLAWAKGSSRRQVWGAMVMVRVKGAVSSGSWSRRPWAL